MTRFGFLMILIAMMSVTSMSSAAEHPDARRTSINSVTFYQQPGGKALHIGNASLLRHLDLELASSLYFSYRPVGMVDADGNWLRSLVAHQQGTILSAALGIYDRVQVSVALPAIFNQEGEYPGRGLGDVSAVGFGALRTQIKVGLFELRGVRAAMELPVEWPTGAQEAWLSAPNPTLSPALILSRQNGPVSVTFKLGYDWRGRQEIIELVEDDRITTAMLLEWTPTTRADLTISAGVNAHLQYASIGAPEAIGAQWAGGAYYGLTKRWRAGLIGMGALTETAALPAMVALAHLSYTFAFGVHPPDCSDADAYLEDNRCQAPDSDRDGILDPQDACPNEPEDEDGFEDADGCPDTDNDADKILDATDKCPLSPEDYDGFEDTDGCPELDNDQDGIPDKKDNCPLKAENVNGYEDTDGCPEPDADNDGILDDKDTCPKRPEDKDGFEDDDGCPDPDNDQDGIPDEDDVCPKQAENFNGYRDKDGCPDKVLAVRTRGEIRITEEIHFDHGQVVPKRRSRKVLKAVLAVIRANPKIRVNVVGHTDSLGGADFNHYLSKARSQAIRDYLVRHSNPKEKLAERLFVLGRGKAEPKSSNRFKEGRASNRRVRFIIIK
jgi:outer membrane protein OmpA-like peptidoglycan-associated protein